MSDWFSPAAFVVGILVLVALGFLGVCWIVGVVFVGKLIRYTSKILVVGALVLGFSSSSQALDRWFWMLQGAGAADLVTTELVLHRPGGFERNPIAQNRGARVTLKVGTNAFVWWGARELERNGHKRIASIVRTSVLSVQCFATGWNVGLTLRY